MKEDPEFVAFCGRVLSELGVEYGGQLSAEVDLFEDLGLDSLQAFELLVVTEELAAEGSPMEESSRLDSYVSETQGTEWTIFSLGDAYAYMKSLKLRRDPSPSN